MGISSTLSSKVTHLLCEQVGSSKYVKAKAKGIPIKDEAWVHREISGAGKKLTKKKGGRKRKLEAKEEKEKKEDFTSLTVSRLKALCREKGIPVTGAKKHLVARLQKTIENEEEEEKKETKRVKAKASKKKRKGKGKKEKKEEEKEEKEEEEEEKKSTKKKGKRKVD